MKSSNKFKLRLVGFCAAFVIMFGVATGFTCVGGWGSACSVPDEDRYFVPDTAKAIAPGWQFKMQMLSHR